MLWVISKQEMDVIVWGIGSEVITQWKAKSMNFLDHIHLCLCGEQLIVSVDQIAHIL